jgi:dolichyl-phosphate-mannose-protein mannosyltransferase
MNRTVIVALLCITAASAMLHIWRLDYPTEPVFDEAHFATYAGDYVTGTGFFDIHPPLGKLFYAADIALQLDHVLPSWRSWQFATIGVTSSTGGRANVIRVDRPFGEFPYQPLRELSALVGAMLPLAFFAFLLALEVSAPAALVGAALVMLENSLLLETRLILLNGMYLAAGFAALALFMKRAPWAVAGGVLWGIALATKLIAIVFLAPVALVAVIDRSSRRRAAIFAAVGMLMLAGAWSVDAIVFTPAARIAPLEALGTPLRDPGHMSVFRASVTDVVYGGVAYLGGGSDADAATRAGGPQTSAWYEWPLMRQPMPYYYAGTAHPFLELTGNPVVWLISGLAVLAGLLYLARRLFARLRAGAVGETLREHRTLAILCAGYLGSLLIYPLLVRRGTYLYHYFPALLFGIGIAAWWFDRLASRSPSRRAAVLAAGALLGLSAVGFLLYAPAVYGL